MNSTSRMLWITILVLALVIVACQPEGDSPTPGESTAPPAEETDTEPVSQGAIESDSAQALPTPLPPEDGWLTSVHADSFVMTEDGVNSTCARCHSPVNWVPTMDDMPESCYVCKFEIDPPPPVIKEEEWEHVPCKVCHQVKKDEVQAEFAWLEIAAIEEYAEVASSTELCLKCHGEVDIPDHRPIQVSAVHADITCTECHDAHATTATCSNSDCHEVLASIPGHDEDHQAVSCMACHDADELQVGPDEQEGIWVTSLEQAGAPYTSHNVQLEAPCDRCHYPDNPWGLSDTVSTES